MAPGENVSSAAVDGGGDDGRLAGLGAAPLPADWEWCNDGLRWSAYPPAISACIEAAFTSGRSCVNIVIAKSSYSVRFEGHEIVQKNLKTGRTRPVKRQASDGLPVSWLWWESERKFWHTYDAELAKNIEEAWKESILSKTNGKRNAPAGLLFMIHRQAYSIEFERDGRQCNTETLFSRGVRRRLCAENTLYQEEGVAEASSSDSISINDTNASVPSSSNPSPTSVFVNNTLQTVVGPQLACGQRCASEGPSYNTSDVVDLKDPPEAEDCSICLSSLQENPSVILAKCKHLFHRECICSWFRNRPTCPECLTVYGIIVGTQPPGEMHVKYLTYRPGKCVLAGYPNTDVIKIVYTFPNGIQSAEHPNPGKPYFGTIRTAYLPKNSDGEEVLELLRKAWSRRLLFCVGTSVTTGRSNAVTWAGIHHKTRMDGGSSSHGYPDETYFARVKKELEEAGVMTG